MKRIVWFIAFAAGAGCDGGNQARMQDRAMNEMAVAMQAAASSVVIAPATSPAQRALFEQNLVAENATYLTLSASPEELDFLRKIEGVIPTVSNDQALGSRELRRIMARTSALKSVGADIVGTLPDAGRRESVLFRLPTHKLGMLAVWDYKADDGKMFVMQDFLKFRVAGEQASLSLSQNFADARCIWTLSWNTDTEDYALYLEDERTPAGSTRWHPDSIRAFAEELTR